MKKTLLTVVILAILSFLVYWVIDMYTFADGVKEVASQQELSIQNTKIQNGDIIFQTSKSNQSKAIQLATKSKYSHMGIVYENDGQYFVYEAVQPVTLTPLQEWIRRGKNGHYVIKRLSNADQVLTNGILAKMKQVGEKFRGKSYDIYFEWSDDKIYCSELVWKIYKEAANIEIGQLEKLSDFDLTHAVVRAKMKERYGTNIPLNEKVISPAAMFASDKLILVEEK
ncbi:MAG: YiiX family permuted papain-like enzyme [Bacteroidota bacterium]